LVVSAVSGERVPEVLRALFKIIEQARRDVTAPSAADAAWHT
jgi:hypothetical protein